MAYRIVSTASDRIVAEGGSVVVAHEYREHRKTVLPALGRRRPQEPDGVS